MPQRSFEKNMGRHNPFSGYFKDNLFESRMDNAFRPSTNTITSGDRYEVHLALPGYKKNSINISVEKNVLTIKAEDIQETEVTENYTRREFYQVGFTHSLSLPDDVNEDKIEARFEDGILKVSIGRHDHDPKQRSRKIEIL